MAIITYLLLTSALKGPATVMRIENRINSTHCTIAIVVALVAIVKRDLQCPKPGMKIVERTSSFRLQSLNQNDNLRHFGNKR
jgi:hypothetical protein